MVESLIERIENSWSSCEMSEFHFHMKYGMLSKAKSMLRNEKFTKEEIDSLITYISDEMNQRYTLVEVPKEDFQNLADREEIIVSFGGRILTARVVTYDGKMQFLSASEGGCVNIERANQIWKKVKI